MASISARPDAASNETFSPASATIAIVTYNRSGLLTKLLESITAMDPKPGHVVIVDNASTDDTTAVVEAFRERLGAELVYRRLDENTGGSGGFSEGMRVAYELGSTWIWLMDDDVEVLPDGLAKMGAWAPRFKSIQGRRYDFDGSEFYWQYRVAEPLAIPIPYAPSGFDESGYKEMNSGCFEGMFIHRDIVGQIGLPDPRFFIYWDDQTYGWLASRITRSVIVNEFVLRRTREIKQWDMGIRHMNASSNAYRYYIMRNRAIIKRYYRSLGVYNPVLFGLGTALTFGKELIRLLLVERTVRGTSNLFRGLRDGRKISRDAAWKPMPPLVAAGAAS
ncbi:glycosyltransferase family 2 protein [Microbacterium hominis]|uniref:Glycosyl transferase n=1 Tax=Microbacterium hominis TaxID=162426 RepID=A0A0B4D5U5_9MICO|nr:glycosyltransferase family 2 protein [Microbacterium hominis]KIC59555.1 glycosyl transferase [Microbacterium hominis]